MFFSSEQRPRIRSQHPDDSLGDVAKKLGLLWKQMSKEDKKPYEKMAAKDKERYLEEVSQLKEGGRLPSKGGNKKQAKKPVPIEDDGDEDDEEDEEEEDDSSD